MARSWWSRRSARSHLSDELILLHIDGGLEAREDERVAWHLRECWHCRASRERLESAIAAFMEERRSQVQGHEEDREDHRAFASRLSCHAVVRLAASPRPGSFLLVSMKRALWPLAAAAAAIAAVGGWTPVRNYVLDLLTAEVSIEAPNSRISTRPPLELVAPPLPPAAVVPTPLVPAAEPGPPMIGPTFADLEATEFAAYLTVHELGLCRGGSIEIQQLPGQAVLVAGVAENAELGSLLAVLLGGFGHIRLRLVAPDDELLPAPDETVPVVVLEGRPPLLENRLKEHFRRHSPPDRAGADLAEFASRAIRLAGAAHVEAQALRTLSTVFTARRVHAMNPAERARFSRLVEEHFEEYRQSLAQLGLLLDRLDPQAAAAGAGENPVFAPADDWGFQLERHTARIDHLARGLFAGLDLRGLDGDTAWSELMQIRQRLEAWLRHHAAQDASAWLENGVKTTKSTEPQSR